jgi:hypothetical protein
MLTENNGREIFVTRAGGWEFDERGWLVVSRKEARDLVDHLHWQLETEGPPEEDG